MPGTGFGMGAIKKFFKYALVAALLFSPPVILADSGLLLGPGGGGGTSGGPTYTNTTPTPVTIGGILAGSTFTAQTMQQMWDRLLYPYIAPTVVLNTTSPLPGVREVGTSLSPINLHSVTTRHTNPISLVEFYRNSVLIHTQASPLPNGGNEDFVDSTAVSSNTSYFVRVGDGTATTDSNIQSYTFLPGIYHGVSPSVLTTGAEIMSNFSASVALSSSRAVTYTFDATGGGGSNYLYIAYPVIYGPVAGSTFGGFAFSDYTTVISPLTNASGLTQNYYILRTNNVYSSAGLIWAIF